MKMNDINKIFTEKVTELITQGYTINVATMGGSQGEIGKVDLVKGEELIRVWLTSETDYEIYVDTVTLRVGRWNYSAIGDTWKTVWLSDFDITEIIRFYKFGRHGYYITDIEEAEKAREISQERARRRWESESKDAILDDEVHQEIAVKYMKRKHGYKRVSRNNIYVRYYPNSHKYSVVYNGTEYNLK